MENKDWKEVKAIDVIDLISGFAFKSSNFILKQEINTLPIIKIKNVANGDVNLNDVVYYSFNPKLELYKISKNDVLIAMTGNHIHAKTQIVGDVSLYKLDVEALLNQRVGKIIIKDNGKTDLKFIYYLFKDKDTKLTLASKASGSANQANISKNDILNLELLLPPLAEQKAIANILSSLDDKIDLLQEQNKTLEAMAETLFRQWFIEEAKEDWEEVELRTLIDIIIDNRGKTPPTLDTKTEYPLIEVNAIASNSCLINYDVIRKYVDKSTYETWFRKHLHINDIILSTVGTIGVFSIFTSGIGCIAQNLIGLRPKVISSYFLYNYLKLNKDTILSLDIGGVQPSIKVPHLLDLNLSLPPKNLLEKFDKEAKILFDKISINAQQIQTLTALRDTLLPKLMSGELRVEDLPPSSITQPITEQAPALELAELY